ncbi:MAG TPA: tautomerase family protein [Eoetvoesiella sp.]
MPYVTITASQGFSAEQKKQLLEQSSAAVVQSIGAPKASVRIMLQELPDGHYLSGDSFDELALMYVVDMIEGRSIELKAALIKALSRAGSQATGVSESDVRVRVFDVPRTDIGLANGITAAQAGR